LTETDPPRRFLLVWFDANGEIDRERVNIVRRAIEDQVDSPRDHTEIDLWIESGGGDAHAAYKLALLLRATAHRVRVVIPDWAKSAATLLTLVGDEIFMAPAADLGPLDAQMLDEGSYSGSISALNIARAADEVARDAIDMAVKGGVDLLAITGLSRAQTLEAMLDFSATFSEPLVRQLDPKVVHHAKQMLQVTAKYAEQLLKEAQSDAPRAIATALVETFPTHGYVISRDEARDLGLPIRHLEEYEHARLVRSFHRNTEDGAKIIELVSLDQPADSASQHPQTNPRRRGGANAARRRRPRSQQNRSNGSRESVTHTR
jgi:hypothetical protein